MIDAPIRSPQSGGLIILHDRILPKNSASLEELALNEFVNERPDAAAVSFCGGDDGRDVIAITE